MKPLVLLFATAATLFADPEFESEFQKLRDQRAAALATIDRQYQTDLESLLKRATQAGDEAAARAIRQVLGQFQANAKDILGLWKMTAADGYISEREIRADGTVTGGGNTGTWTVEGNKLRIAYGANFADVLNLPPFNDRMAGKNGKGGDIIFTKK